MIRTLKLESSNIREMLKRDNSFNSDVEGIVSGILENVRKNGDTALREYTEKFDKVKLDKLEVSEEEIDQALKSVEPEFISVLKEARNNIERFHRHQLRSDFIDSSQDGMILGQRFLPIERVGIYVPGGTAAYPSSVLMNAVPAKLAGVEELIMVTPPAKDGSIPAAILSAASIAGVTRVFKVGGAQAIAALAYGTQSIPRVYKIVGPGNIFVATAKRMILGQAGIDMFAGPSEILVIADKNSDPKFVAADMLSQAEHDKLASAVLVTDSQKLADDVSREIEKQIPLLPRAEICRESIDNNGRIYITDDLLSAAEACNEIAPEHLELCVDDPFMLLSHIRNAGSIFLGRYTPEALGDYFAGTNHVLPTSGTAHFSSPLSVDDFIKKSTFICYSKEALRSVSSQISTFADKEGLRAHGKSVEVRFE